MDMKIKSCFFGENRKELMSRIPEGTAVFLFAGELRPQSRDNDYRFLVDRNFYYMTGIADKPGSVLVLIKETDGGVREMLFVPHKDPLTERWHGKRDSHEEVSLKYGFAEEDIYDEEEFPEKEIDLLHGSYSVAYDGSSIGGDTGRFISKIDGGTDIAQTFKSMRMIKKPEETDAIRVAAKITEDAIDDMKKMLREGVTELEIYAELEYQMARRESLIPAFGTIVAIDDNAFYLHHGEPEGKEGKRLEKGSQIQIDVGARCDGYCADISRVIIFGKKEEDDPRRRRLIGLIRELRKEAVSFIKPGETILTLNAKMHDIAGDWLLAEGLIDEKTDEKIRNYYWHNTSHHLGLDVHDVGERDMPFEAGVCLALEPGVYIPEWNMGFRIEDDVLVTEGGCGYLSSGDDSDDGIYVG